MTVKLKLGTIKFDYSSVMLPLPEHLQRSLSELHQYYQQIHEDYAKKLEAAREQVGHLQALRSGAIPPPAELEVHLQELERYYVGLGEENALNGLNAADQLDRVSALIAGTIGHIAPTSEKAPSLDRGSTSEQEDTGLLEQPSSSEIESAPESQEPGEKADATEELAALESEPELLILADSPEPDDLSLDKFLKTLHSATRIPLSLCLTKGNLFIEERNGIKTLVIVSPSKDLEKRVKARLLTYQQRFSSWIGEKTNVILETKFNSDAPQFLLSYYGLSLEQALAKLLSDNRGAILQRDYIVRSLYGEVPQEVRPVTYRNVSQALKAGVKSLLWDVDPDNADCYTLNYAELLQAMATPKQLSLI